MVIQFSKKKLDICFLHQRCGQTRQYKFMWHLHFNSVCIVSHISLYFCTYSAVRVHKQVILVVDRRRIRDIYTTWCHFQKADLISGSGPVCSSCSRHFSKETLWFFLQDLEENVPGCSRCTISFVEQGSEGVGLDGRRNYGPLMLHWEGSCIFKWVRLKVGTLAVLCANQASSVTCH